MEAFTKLGSSLGSDLDHDGVITLSLPPGEYTFTMTGDASGVYLMQVFCVSGAPTENPSYAPVDHPITPHPSRSSSPPTDKSVSPSQAPNVVTPTTMKPSVLPTKTPTKRPVKVVTSPPSQAETTRDESESGYDTTQGDNEQA
eukprot:979732_1